MIKRKTSNNIGTIVLILIILAVIYFSFESLGPIITDIIQQEMDKSNTEVNTLEGQEQLISYEEKQRLMDKFPNYNFTGKVYYTVYGKRVLEDDTYLDLSDVQIDENLIDNLTLLTNIKEVNLYNQ